jgi:hypothetical protein
MSGCWESPGYIIPGTFLVLIEVLIVERLPYGPSHILLSKPSRLITSIRNKELGLSKKSHVHLYLTQPYIHPLEKVLCRCSA